LRQVIVNTHSPVLVNEMIKWKDDKSVSVNFAEMRTRIMIFEDKKRKLNISKITPVSKDGQTTILFSEQDRKLTIQTIKEYLQTIDFESTRKSIEE